MTTNKQIEYIKKLCAWKGQDPDWDAINAMADTEASALIDRLKELPSVKDGQEATKWNIGGLNGTAVPGTAPKPAAQPAPNMSGFNKYQAGMAKKVVAAEKTSEWIGQNPEAFAELVEGVYEAFEAADAALQALHPGGDDR